MVFLTALAHILVTGGLLLQEFLAIQNNGPKNIGFFGTRNMGFMHQQLIEVLSYAIVLTVSGPPSIARSGSKDCSSRSSSSMAQHTAVVPEWKRMQISRSASRILCTFPDAYRGTTSSRPAPLAPMRR